MNGVWISFIWFIPACNLYPDLHFLLSFILQFNCFIIFSITHLKIFFLLKSLIAWLYKSSNTELKIFMFFQGEIRYDSISLTLWPHFPCSSTHLKISSEFKKTSKLSLRLLQIKCSHIQLIFCLLIVHIYN